LKYFSIIIPFIVFDKKLDLAIKSLIKQKFRNFEVLLIYNGSNKKSLKYLNKFIKINYRELAINLFKSKKKFNISEARNEGILKANGEYIVFLDSDDQFKNNSLHEIYFELNKHKPELSIYNYQSNKKNKITADIKNLNKKNIFKNITDLEAISLTCWRFIIKRNFLLKKNILFNPKIIINEDNLFATKLINCANTFLVSEKIFYIYNHNKDGMTNNSLNLNDLKSKILKGSVVNLNEVTKLILNNKKINFLKKKFLFLRIKDLVIKNFIFSNLLGFYRENKSIKSLKKKERLKIDKIMKDYFNLDKLNLLNKNFFLNLNKIILENKTPILFSYTHISSLIGKYLNEINYNFEIIDNSKILQKQKIYKKKIRSISFLNKIDLKNYILIISHTSKKIYKEINNQIKKNCKNKKINTLKFEDLLKNNEKHN